MSGGQQQRVGIAMAFSCRPRVIVLDEPTTGLDVTTQRRVLETVRQMTTEHQVTSVYVSHDLAVVAQLADQTAVLYAGRLVEHAGPTPSSAAWRHPYAVGLLKAVPSSARSEILVGIEGRPPRPGRWPRGCSFADRCGNVQDACRQELPQLRDLGDSEPHWVRCYFPEPPVAHAKEPVPALSGDPPPVLTVRGVAASYGPRQVLRNVSFDVTAGRCTAVVGTVGFRQDNPGLVPGRAAHRLDLGGSSSSPEPSSARYPRRRSKRGAPDYAVRVPESLRFPQIHG